MAGGGQGLNSGSVAEAALTTWFELDPEGYAIDAASISKTSSLRRIAGSIPCRPAAAAELGRLFAEAEGSGDSTIFCQMLRPQDGKVQFLYFWKAFAEAARIAGAVAIDTENLSVELEMLRDRILRCVEEALLDDTSSVSTKASKTELSVGGLQQELNRASSMSAYPEFWQKAADCLKGREETESLSLEEVTTLLLSWLPDASLFEHRTDAPPTPTPAQAGGLRVLLHVYDVSQESSIQKINKVLAYKHFPLKFGGVFHAGVEVNAMEWCFGFSASKTHPGVSCIEPKTHPQHHYRQTVDMGYTKCSDADVIEIVTQLLEEYPGDDYDLLRRNCCHFADDFTKRLGVGGIPGWVIRLAKVGASVDSMIQSAPKPIRQRLGYDSDSD